MRGVVLAAGGSVRMGRSKALLDWHGVPLVRAHVAALGPFCDEVVVVTGADAHAVADAARTRTIFRPDWATTEMIDSVRVGVAGASSALVVPVDTVPADAALLEALLAAEGAAVPVGPDGRRGHPVRLDAVAIRLLATSPTLSHALGHAVEVPTSSACAVDFDDPASWADVRGPTRRR